MERLVERVVEDDQSSNQMIMAMVLSGVPRPVDDADAIVVMPGLGENWRLIDGVRAWNMSNNARHLLIAGIYDGEKTKIQPTLEYLSKKPFNLGRTEGVVIQPHAHHTKEQAEWIFDQVQENNISSLALFVSPYHIMRAYCTVLKTFIKYGDFRIPMIPVPVAISPDTIIPETGVDAWKMAYGESQRIAKYQALGDVANMEELKEYFDWLYKQPIISSRLAG